MVQNSGVHQLRLVVSPIIYKVLCMPGGYRRISEPSAVLCINTFPWSTNSKRQIFFGSKGVPKNFLSSKSTDSNLVGCFTPSNWIHFPLCSGWKYGMFKTYHLPASSEVVYKWPFQGWKSDLQLRKSEEAGRWNVCVLYIMLVGGFNPFETY